MKKQRGMGDILLILVVIAIGWFFGRLWAHGEISRECERLGAFFYGSTVYSCEVKKP